MTCAPAGLTPTRALHPSGRAPGYPRTSRASRCKHRACALSGLGRAAHAALPMHSRVQQSAANTAGCVPPQATCTTQPHLYRGYCGMGTIMASLRWGRSSRRIKLCTCVGGSSHTVRCACCRSVAAPLWPRGRHASARACGCLHACPPTPALAPSSMKMSSGEQLQPSRSATACATMALKDGTPSDSLRRRGGGRARARVRRASCVLACRRHGGMAAAGRGCRTCKRPCPRAWWR